MKSEEVLEKRKQTWLSKYGVDNPNKSRLVRSKMETTNKEKYGVSHPAFQLSEFTDKREKTWLDKYGYTHPNSVPGVAQERARIRRENHFEQFIQDLAKNKLVPNFDVDRYKEDSGIYSYHCNRCGNNFNSWLSEVYNLECPYCRRSGTSSRLEISLYDWLSDIGVKRIIAGDRKVIAPLELDFYLPDYNLAVEVDGLYWHSDLKKSKDYHLNKTLSCQEKGIRLIHFTDNELEDKPKICKSIIFSALGMNRSVYARNCEVREISSSIARDFCNRNHIQGYYIGANISLGLYNQDKLLQVCTFGKSRFSPNETELLRHCSRLGTTVIGGFSKLIKYYIRTYNPENLITYCDRRIFTGNGYLKSGWELVAETPVNYWYFSIKEYYLQSRMKFQKYKLASVLPNFDPELTEGENMSRNGWMRYYDCGSLKLRYKLPSSTI